VAERAGQLAQHRVRHHHRRELAAGQHVAADRELLAAEVVDHPLVEALVASAQQGDGLLPRERVGERVVEQPAARGQGDHPALLLEVDRSTRSGRAGPPRRRRRAGTIPAPPPNGTSSTRLFFIGVVSR
jgi:hypothetical protein